MFSINKPLKKFAQSVRTASVATALVGFVAMPAPVQAFGSPFTAMSGSWSGTGTITTSDGNKERIRCRAKYDVGGAGSNVDLTIRCAGDSYNFELQSNATHNNGAVSGNWSENTRRVGGNIEGTARGNAISVRVSGGHVGDARDQHKRESAVDLDPGAGHRIAVGGDLDEPRRAVVSRRYSAGSVPGRARSDVRPACLFGAGRIG